MSYISEDARTLYETFRRGSYESNNGPCLGWRDSLTSPYQASASVIIPLLFKPFYANINSILMQCAVDEFQ